MYDQYVPGDIIPSAAMNAAINQGVIPFANAAARDAAIPAPTIGMQCFLTGSGTVQRHNGFVWVGDTAPRILTFINGWSNSSSSLIVNHLGVVELEIAAWKSSGNATVLCILPSTFWPDRFISAAAWCQIGTGYALPGRITIGYDGTVKLLPGASEETITECGASITYVSNFLDIR